MSSLETNFANDYNFLSHKHIKYKIVKDNDPALVYIFGFSFLSASKRILFNCFNET